MATKTTPHVPEAPQLARETTNGLAITSLVLGILTFSGFLFLTGIPAIITGIMSLRKGQRERGMSIAGIVLGAIGTFISFLLLILLVLLVGLGIMSHPAPQETPSSDTTMPSTSTQT